MQHECIVVTGRLTLVVAMAVAMVAIGGCVLGLDYERPAIEGPQAFRQPARAGESVAP